MRVFSKAQIVAHFNPELAVSQLEEGFIAHSEGKVQVPPCRASHSRARTVTVA